MPQPDPYASIAKPIKAEDDPYAAIAGGQPATASAPKTLPSGLPAGSFQAVPEEQTEEGHKAAIAKRESQEGTLGQVAMGIGKSGGMIPFAESVPRYLSGDTEKPDLTAHGTAQTIGKIGGTAAMVAPALTNPLMAARMFGGGIVGNLAGQFGSKLAGAGENAQDVWGDVGSLAGGTLGTIGGPKNFGDIKNWARGNPNAAITDALHVSAKSPKMQSAIADVEGSRPYLQGAKSQAEVQSRLPGAKAEVWDNYAKAVESVKDQPVQGPDGPTTVGELEAARLKNSADLQAARKIRPTDQQTALQKQENLTRMVERDKRIKSVLDPILQKTGIDPATIREVHGHLKGVERNVSGKSTITEQMRPYGFGKMLPHRVRGFGTGSPTLGTSWQWEPIQGVKDIVAGRPKFHGKPTDVAMKDLFAPKRAKPNLSSIRKP